MSISQELMDLISVRYPFELFSFVCKYQNTKQITLLNYSWIDGDISKYEFTMLYDIIEYDDIQEGFNKGDGRITLYGKDGYRIVSIYHPLKQAPIERRNWVYLYFDKELLSEFLSIVGITQQEWIQIRLTNVKFFRPKSSY